jgi:hypothetical protein
MKFKYLDIHNCTALMPNFDGRLVSHVRQFDNYLGSVNERLEPQGLIETLIKHNRRTSGLDMTERMYSIDADIGVTINLADQTCHYEVKEYFKYPELARPEYDQRVVAQFWVHYENGNRWGYKLPLQCLLKNWGDANEGYQGYLHTLTTDKEEFSYAGITKRNWLARLNEHLHEMRTGSRKTFHQAWRDSLSIEKMTYGSELLRLNYSYEDSMGWEEYYVDEHTLTPKGLNMIPGGFKGLRLLHQLRITDQIKISLEERDRAVAEYIRRNPRKGIPNPFISELWKDDHFYLRVIESREKTLSAEQVKQIRTLADLGWMPAQIVDEVEALNELQVRNVLKGRTYTRMQ